MAGKRKEPLKRGELKVPMLNALFFWGNSCKTQSCHSKVVMSGISKVELSSLDLGVLREDDFTNESVGARSSLLCEEVV